MASTNSHVSYLTPPSDSETLPLPWDVFLSFHGPDTRSKFVSHLYQRLDDHGIRTFRDNPELCTGEVITEALVKAIQGSKTYVVVFSENYAQSSWCLDELVEIYQCYQNKNRLVIGVYYNIDPSVVRHQTKSFDKAFEKHQSRFSEKVNNWRVTLKKVADFSGQTVSPQRDESDIINEIVDVILREIKPKILPVADFPVGLDSRVKDITTLLSSATGVIKFGIYGMGGVGKTTLAKALYNQLLVRRFKGSCFLADVREASGRANGLVSLQQQLLDDFLRSKKRVKVHNVSEGTMLIEKIICSESAKVLILIDDVDDFEQYHSLIGPFASGSVVIITTRDEEILDKIEIEPRYRYNVTGLDDAKSRELFTQHAFGNAEPDNTLMVLFKDILPLSGRLPLALKVFGSYLSTKSEEGWKAYIDSMRRNFNSTVEQNLIISLDALESEDHMLKKMFLDVACFFIGRQKKEVVKIMETYYFNVDHYFGILKKRCLLEVNNRDELVMHDLLRDMGRKVAQNKFPDNVGKHSRLWVSKDICDVLSKKKGTEEIEGVIPSNFHYEDALEGATFATESFKRMDKLRFLYLKNVKLSGSFEEIFEDLRWFGWECCPLECLPSDFGPEKLVLLALPGSKMKTMWKLDMVPSAFEKLKTLDMSYSLDLIMTPDFSKFPHLETLNFKGCKSLKEVHISIGSLVRLVSLDLGDCVNLRSLPENICNLKALNSLNIGGCSTLLGSLTEVNAWGLTVWKLPTSFGHLSKLVELNPRDDYHFSETVSYAAPTRWDVFLCFRGTDARETFSHRLYKALSRNFISVYMDNPEVRSREKAITHVLPKAIKESKMYVVVFSEDYAFSERCLDELVEILKCHKEMKRLVIPVFYKIDPSDVRLQIGSFKEAFDKNHIRYAGEIEKVNNWCLSLKEVADFSGIHISGIRDESKIISKISNMILIETQSRILHIPKYTVGLDSHVKGLTKLLSSDIEGVIEFGIYGMGGVGKTTLAKALYNQLLLEGSFKHSCFLAEVREASGKPNGLVSLQEQLVSDVLKKKVKLLHVGDGKSVIEKFVCPTTKLLVLIDDVDDIKQYEFLVGPFSRGSIVIITTRDQNILDRIGVEPKYQYRVNELDDADSLALFSQHAFGNDKPNNTFMALSEDILRLAGGLPLALNVFGSYLSTKSEVAWKSYIEGLKRSPNSIIREKLIISLDALELDEKEIFLDIACFFIGWKKEDVVRILETYYYSTEYTLYILKERCLLTINNRDKVGMHNLLQDIGRDVARKFSAQEPGKQSRLWVLQDTIDVLSEDKGTEAIEGIVPHYHRHQGSLEGLSFDVGAFRRMIALRFLYLKNVNLSGSFEQIFENLRFLCWEGCPLKCLPSKFHPRKLVILELRHSKLTRMWEHNMASGVFDKLTTLDMSYSLDLTTTSDFSKLPCLETLILEGCTSLEEVHISIGSLLRLVFLNLKYCCNVTSLSNLKQLKFLDITGCSSLTDIQGVEELTSLRELHLEGCKASLQAYILTRRIFQIYSELGHQIRFYIQAVEFPDWIRQLPDWIRQSSNSGSTASFNLPPYESHNFLAMILCFNWGDVPYGKKTYSVKNTRSGFIWKGSCYNNYSEVQLIIVPRSVFSLEDGDKRIEITANAEILGIHLLCRKEITMTDQSGSSIVNFVEERLVCSTEITVTDQLESPNFDVLEERLLYRTEITMTDQFESPDDDVLEERLLYKTEITLTDQFESPNFDVLEERLLYSTEITEERLLYRTEITLTDQFESPNFDVLEERLLYSTEITVTGQSESPNVDVLEERLMYRTEITMTDQFESPNFDVLEERLLYSTEITMTDQSDTPNISVLEERWHPSKWLKLLPVRHFWNKLLICLRIYLWKKFKTICYLFWPSWILYWVRRRLAQYKDDRKKSGNE